MNLSDVELIPLPLEPQVKIRGIIPETATLFKVSLTGRPCVRLEPRIENAAELPSWKMKTFHGETAFLFVNVRLTGAVSLLFIRMFYYSHYCGFFIFGCILFM